MDSEGFSAEQVQKINNMAKALKESGLVYSMDDAVERARSILGFKPKVEVVDEPSVEPESVSEEPVEDDIEVYDTVEEPEPVEDDVEPEVYDSDEGSEPSEEPVEDVPVESVDEDPDDNDYSGFESPYQQESLETYESDAKDEGAVSVDTEAPEKVLSPEEDPFCDDDSSEDEPVDCDSPDFDISREEKTLNEIYEDCGEEKEPEEDTSADEYDDGPEEVVVGDSDEDLPEESSDDSGDEDYERFDEEPDEDGSDDDHDKIEDSSESSVDDADERSKLNDYRY